MTNWNEHPAYAGLQRILVQNTDSERRLQLSIPLVAERILIELFEAGFEVQSREVSEDFAQKQVQSMAEYGNDLLAKLASAHKRYYDPY